MVGAVDDMRSLPATVRLLMQGAAVGALIAALPDDVRILPQLPWWIERAGLFLGGVWFVNLVNFMDGIDWMTVAEFVPVTGAIVLLGLPARSDCCRRSSPPRSSARPSALHRSTSRWRKLFLGDVGSLPMGLLLGWLLLQLAGKGHLAAALILPLYYLADATLTLVRRIAKGERIWQAHRTHFYQRATDNGFTVAEIVTRVFLVNLALAALALVTVAAPSIVVSLAALAGAAAIVAWLLVTLARGKR